jgi:hypothetical protein
MSFASTTPRPAAYSGRAVEVVAETPASAVTWSAILAGAAVALASSVVLLSLAAGLGFLSLKPAESGGPSASTGIVVIAISLVVIQWVSSGLGGYLAGRLRVRWSGVHPHEVFFRDTAHGFVAWAVATLVASILIVGSAGSIIGGAAKMVSGLVGQAASGAGQGAASNSSLPSLISGYDTDSLFRPSAPNANAASQDMRSEAGRILTQGLTGRDFPAADRSYLAQMVATQAGLSQQDAEKRVDDTIARVRAAKDRAAQLAADAAKAAVSVSIFTFLSMVVGAFIACIAAALGGKWRDE